MITLNKFKPFHREIFYNKLSMRFITFILFVPQKYKASVFQTRGSMRKANLSHRTIEKTNKYIQIKYNQFSEW